MRPDFTLRSVTAALCLALTVVSAAAQSRPLRILLTNDDGFDSAGLRIMREALVGAGFQVTVVAPATNMSSTGMSMTSGVIKYEQKGEGVFAISGTPADSAQIGLNVILRETPPDLVVSGTNAGQNIGTSAHSSGTISAALISAINGVPAIAASAGTGKLAESAYRTAAGIVTQMIAALEASRPAGGKLLPERTMVNVNVPAIEKLLGVRWAPLSNRGGFTRQFSSTGNPNEIRAQLMATPTPANETASDLALFNQGYVTISILDGRMDVDHTGAGKTTADRLSKVALPQSAAVPAR
jgi:5'/3'-nucleotidase SurE